MQDLRLVSMVLVVVMVARLVAPVAEYRHHWLMAHLSTHNTLEVEEEVAVQHLNQVYIV